MRTPLFAFGAAIALAGCGLAIDLAPRVDAAVRIDAGVDARVDGGTSDADVMDGWVDAPIADAIEVDANEADAIEVDANEADAIEVDAVAADASELDANEADANEADAGARCGNGRLEAGEECDDGNFEPGDGCEPGCQLCSICPSTCVTELDCPFVSDCAPRSCTDGMCRYVLLDDASLCALRIGDLIQDGACHGGYCGPTSCGDGVINPNEECDDRNVNSNDGCEATCVYTCGGDGDCDDGDPCNGVERCVEGTCERTPSCDEHENDCEIVTCTAFAGCVEAPNDADHDGYVGPESCRTPGGDCAVEDPTRFPGAFEVIDGKDNDCDGFIDNRPSGAPPHVTYLDRDHDGYGDPSSPSTSLDTDGNYVPLAGDCDDSERDANPGQRIFFDHPRGGAGARSYDWDCDGAATRATTRVSYGDCATRSAFSCESGSGWIVATRGGDAPECGEVGAFRTCVPATFGATVCVGFEESRTQTCR